MNKLDFLLLFATHSQYPPELGHILCCVLLPFYLPVGTTEEGSPAALHVWYTAPRCSKGNSEIPFPTAMFSSQSQTQVQETYVGAESKCWDISLQSQGSRWFLTNHCQFPHLRAVHGLGVVEV